MDPNSNADYHEQDMPFQHFLRLASPQAIVYTREAKALGGKPQKTLVLAADISASRLYEVWICCESEHGLVGMRRLVDLCTGQTARGFFRQRDRVDSSSHV